MQQCVSSDLGRSATEVVDVVGLEGDEILRSREVKAPVGVRVALGRVRYDWVSVLFLEDVAGTLAVVHV